jgi:hypothetical protein
LSAGRPLLRFEEGTKAMIVLGADMHKRSHTLAAVGASTGELVGEETIAVGGRGFAVALDWAGGLGDDRVWALEDWPLSEQRCGRASSGCRSPSWPASSSTSGC